jgi:hypothetical protein
MIAKVSNEVEWMQFEVVTSANFEKFKVLVNFLGEASSDVMTRKQTEASQDVKDFKDFEQASSVKNSLIDTIKSTLFRRFPPPSPPRSIS